MTMPSSSTPRTLLATNPNPDLYGASRMLLESVEGFRDRGWRVVACVPAPGPLADRIHLRGGEVRPIATPVLRKTYLNPRGLLNLAWRTLRAIPAAVRLLRSARPDVMYVNTITEPLWLVLGRCLRIPIVCHVHEAESAAPRPIRRALAWPLFLAQRLVVNSDFSMRVLTDAAPRLRHRSVVVANGVSGPPEVHAARATLAEPVRLLYVGRLSERKGVADAVDAVKLLDVRGIDASLDIVGSVFPGYEEVDSELRQLATRAGIAERVHFRGFDADVWRHLADTDILVVPSRADEPFGNTAVEALLAARPVVATRTGGLVEAVAGFDAAISVLPGAPEEIADAVEHLVGHWVEYRARALSDSGRAAARHSPERYRSTIVEVVSSLLP